MFRKSTVCYPLTYWLTDLYVKSGTPVGQIFYRATSTHNASPCVCSDDFRPHTISNLFTCNFNIISSRRRSLNLTLFYKFFDENYYVFALPMRATYSTHLILTPFIGLEVFRKGSLL
jgi:hypothetical protein